MEAKFKELTKQFDQYILEIKNTKEYKDYVHAKKVLVEYDTANEIMNQVKELQKAKHSCEKNEQVELVEDIEKALASFNHKYDLLFEVVQFNMAYDNLVELVNQIKYNIEENLN